METMLDPVSIRFSQGSIGEHFKDEPEVSIFETFEKIRDGMQKREVPMMHVVRRQDGSLVTLDNRRLAVYKMASHAGKCGRVKVKLVPLEEVKHELRHKSDSKVEGLSSTQMAVLPPSQPFQMVSCSTVQTQEDIGVQNSFLRSPEELWTSKLLSKGC